MSTHRQYFPDEEDETGAAKALMRLQDTYQLDSEAFSRGKLPGNQGVCTDHFRENEYIKSGRVVCTFIKEREEGKLNTPILIFHLCVYVCVYTTLLVKRSTPERVHVCEIR